MAVFQFSKMVKGQTWPTSYSVKNLKGQNYWVLDSNKHLMNKTYKQERYHTKALQGHGAHL